MRSLFGAVLAGVEVQIFPSMPAHFRQRARFAMCRFDGVALPVPPGFDGTWLENSLAAPADARAAKLAEAAKAPKALLTDIDVNWLQVIAEGWAAPLTGFMREGPLLQALHFNSLLIDPSNATGAQGINTNPTDWNDYSTRARVE